MHPGDIHASGLQRLQDFLRVRLHGRGHRGGVLPLPGGGDILLAGIGPGVAVVEVDQQLQAQRLGAFRFRDHVRLTIPATFGVHPHA